MQHQKSTDATIVHWTKHTKKNERHQIKSLSSQTKISGETQQGHIFRALMTFARYINER